MKKITLLSMIVAIMTLSSCSKQESLQRDDENKSVAFNLMVGDAIAVKSSGANPTRYIMEVYAEDGTTPVLCFDNNTASRSENSTGSFSAVLDNTLKYKCLFWADDNATYNVANLKAIRLASNKTMTENAYFAMKDVENNESSTIELKRAVAQMKYVQMGDYVSTASKTLSVKYATDFTFNVFDGSVAATNAPRTYSAPAAVVADGIVLGTDYIFAPTTASVINVTVSIDGDKEISNIPVRANRRTNLRGQFSASEIDGVFKFNFSEAWNTEEQSSDFANE